VEVIGRSGPLLQVQRQLAQHLNPGKRKVVLVVELAHLGIHVERWGRRLGSPLL
jgi:type II secretory pathway predicted ATPase ExeA